MNKRSIININNEQEEITMRGFVNTVLISTMLCASFIFAKGNIV